MTIQEALALGTRLLNEAGIEGAARDARRLMAALLDVEPGRVTLLAQDEFDPLIEENYISAILERKQRRPLSHLLGYRDFYGRRFSVSSDVLDPRPETETLIEAALTEPFERVLDLGTGSGCILLSLLAEWTHATGIGTDFSDAALIVARRNARALGLTDRCVFKNSDWFDDVGGPFDLIVSNPPYISLAEMETLAPELQFEPRMALTDEEDGLVAYRDITEGANACLRKGGRLMVEIGWQQAAQVVDLFESAGLEHIVVLPDLDQRDRVVSGRKPA